MTNRLDDTNMSGNHRLLNACRQARTPPEPCSGGKNIWGVCIGLVWGPGGCLRRHTERDIFLDLELIWRVDIMLTTGQFPHGLSRPTMEFDLPRVDGAVPDLLRSRAIRLFCPWFCPGRRNLVRKVHGQNRSEKERAKIECRLAAVG